MRTTTALTLLLALALAACSNQRDGESAEDFAARVGEGQPAPVATTAVEAPIAAGTDVLALEQLGNIAGVDLGPRDGACTFASNGVEMLIAGAPADPSRAGRAVVRAGGALYILTSTGGLPAVRRGTRFAGEGIAVVVAGQGQAARLTVTDAAGQTRAFAGSWVCA